MSVELPPVPASCSHAVEAWWRLPRPQRLRINAWAGYIILLTLLFILPLTRLMLYAAQSDLHSHILLVPLISAYLLYIQRNQLPTAFRSSIAATVTMGGIGLAALVAGMTFRVSVNDELSLILLAYVSFVAAGGFLFLGRDWMAAAAFPIAFLSFMVPLPDRVVSWIESTSIVASAEVAAALFQVTDIPVFRDGLVFALPGVAIEVARECSGIRSSWVLLITSVLASQLFLKSPWRRIVLVAFVLPLAVVRNGFRIVVIAMLCVRVGPHMIDSVIHRRGGPVFFAVSLVPLFLLLWWLRRQEHGAMPR